MSELRVVSVPVGELVEFEGNPRRGDVDAIAASLAKRGQYKPIVVNAGSKTGRVNEVLAGNHTLRAARGLGWPEIQCVFVDVAADEAAQIVAADNRIADLGGYDQADLLAVLEAAGFRVRQTLMWVKNALVMGRADYHWKHEPIIATVVPDEVDDYCPFFYGFAPGGEGRLGRGGEHWHGDNKATTVFNVAKPQASREHPTMKPVELIEPMLRNSCRPGGVVVDLFGGSGSTLIAAHHAGVKAVLVELDEKYADVICRRFQQHTGVVPVRDGVEVSFVD